MFIFAANAIGGDDQAVGAVLPALGRDGLDVARLMSDCRNVMFSAGSACASGSGRPSHVLKAIGLSDTQAKSSIRLGFGRYTTLEQLEAGAAAIISAANSQE